MVLSDAAIKRLLEAGRVGIEPYDPELLQPSSVDVRVDRYFRVFRNSRYPFIDVREAQEELTELVEVDDGPFILHPGEFVLGSTLERITLPDDLVARLEGKALALDTEVPTSLGWRLMGELRPGDIVFDLDGAPTVVVAATEPMTDRPCREVLFSDGASVICDASHQWLTIDENGRRHGRQMGRVVTTDEIGRTLTVRGELNHQVPLAAPARVGHTRDRLTGRPVSNTSLNSTLRWSASYAELGASLGLRPTVASKRAVLNGIDKGPKYEVQLTPDRPVFRLTRKLRRQKLRGRFHRFRAIVSVREVPSVPVRCIEVSSPTGTFLVTRSYVATHNSSLGRLGLLIHSTAGFIDPGWDGHVTLELSNVANLPITIYPGMKIGQLSFMQLSEPAERPYGSGGLGSKYQGQRGPTPSRYYRNFESGE